ncbi:16576_t:CDS:1 [Racocetra persica]|uniref:16576_t:CDS:1 n=1 Tax=Racocetra persica TaxID=160502 RepID=A0ACA9K9M6_9GLOM|nr:16576_t:CDS:1 [Racocetra persica]
MKFVRIVDIFVIVCASFFIVEEVKSCETECQNGISNAFAVSWTDEVKPIYGNFQTNVLDHLFYGISSDKVSNDSTAVDNLTKDVRSSVTNQTQSFTEAFISSMAGIIKNAIFNEEPKMKGDCNHPRRVKQPPLGVNWTYDDCIKMDYVCGNPPSICHFLDDNKAKCFRDLKENVTKSSEVGGDYINNINSTVTNILSSYSLTPNGSDYFKKIVLRNVQSCLDSLDKNFNTGFCSDNCTQYDNSTIIPLLLSFP